MKRVFLTLLVFFSLQINAFAVLPFVCSLQGGTIVNGECVFPATLTSPTGYEEINLTEHNYDSLFSFGADAENDVLAQYEYFSLSIPETFNFDKPVNIAIAIKIPEFPLLFIQSDNSISPCNNWYKFNTTKLEKVEILPSMLVSDVFSTIPSCWILVGVEIRTVDTCFYRFEYYWIYIANFTSE